MAFSRLNFSKLWTNPTDFPTIELDETQVRADLQALHDETKTALNKLMTALEAKTAASGLGAKGKDGTTKSTVQAELDALNALIVAAGNLPGGGSAGQILKKNSDTNFDALWTDLTHDSLAYLGVRAIDSFEEDTAANWLARGTGYSYYYNNPSALADQPSERGFLFNTTQGSYVVQEWVSAANGAVYHRVGNTANGWLTSWVQAATKDYVDGYALPKAGGEMSGDVTIRKNGTSGVNLFHTNGRGGAVQQYANALTVTEYEDNTDTGNSAFRRIKMQSAANQSDIAKSLVLQDKPTGGTAVDYTIFHTGSVESLLGASKIATGIYTGNSTTPNNTLYEQTITLGFTPKAVLVLSDTAIVRGYSYCVLAVTGQAFEGYKCTLLKIVTNGFKAASYIYDPAGENVNGYDENANGGGKIYRYIAIG